MHGVLPDGWWVVGGGWWVVSGCEWVWWYVVGYVVGGAWRVAGQV